MADEKSKIVTDATGPDASLAPVQPEAGGGTPAPKQEQTAPEAVSPDKATAPEQVTPTQPEKGADAPKEQKAASVSVFNFSEIMAEKKAAEKAAARQEAMAPDKGTSPTPTKEDGPKQEKPKEQESDFDRCGTEQILREGNHPEGNERPDHQAAGRLEGPAEGSCQAGKEVSRGGEVKPTSGQVGPRVYAGFCPAPRSSKDISYSSSPGFQVA